MADAMTRRGSNTLGLPGLGDTWAGIQERGHHSRHGRGSTVQKGRKTGVKAECEGRHSAAGGDSESQSSPPGQ